MACTLFTLRSLDMSPEPEILVDLTINPPPPAWGVEVDPDAIELLAERWADVSMPLPTFAYPGTPSERPESWWFTYVTLSVSVLACLWPPEGEQMWRTSHDGIWLDDAPGIFASFTRLVSTSGLDLNRFMQLSDDDGPLIFQGEGTLQLLGERVQTLRQVAATLTDRWDGNAANLVAEAGRDATRIAGLLTETVPGYQDRPTTDRGVLPFDKLSHLASAIMAAGVDWSFTNYQNFPVYPDYMLPRVFRHHGVLHYEDTLADHIDNRQLLPAGSEAEHAIRWATVHAGACLRSALAANGNEVDAPGLDYHLWSQAVLGEAAASFGEHHRTITMRY